MQAELRLCYTLLWRFPLGALVYLVIHAERLCRKEFLQCVLSPAAGWWSTEGVHWTTPFVFQDKLLDMCQKGWQLLCIWRDTYIVRHANACADLSLNLPPASWPKLTTLIYWCLNIWCILNYTQILIQMKLGPEKQIPTIIQWKKRLMVDHDEGGRIHAVKQTVFY